MLKNLLPAFLSKTDWPTLFKNEFELQVDLSKDNKDKKKLELLNKNKKSILSDFIAYDGYIPVLLNIPAFEGLLDILCAMYPLVSFGQITEQRLRFQIWRRLKEALKFFHVKESEKKNKKEKEKENTKERIHAYHALSYIIDYTKPSWELVIDEQGQYHQNLMLIDVDDITCALRNTLFQTGILNLQNELLKKWASLAGTRPYLFEIIHNMSVPMYNRIESYRQNSTKAPVNYVYLLPEFPFMCDWKELIIGSHVYDETAIPSTLSKDALKGLQDPKNKDNHTSYQAMMDIIVEAQRATHYTTIQECLTLTHNRNKNKDHATETEIENQFQSLARHIYDMLYEMVNTRFSLLRPTKLEKPYKYPSLEDLYRIQMPTHVIGIIYVQILNRVLRETESVKDVDDVQKSGKNVLNLYRNMRDSKVGIEMRKTSELIEILNIALQKLDESNTAKSLHIPIQVLLKMSNTNEIYTQPSWLDYKIMKEVTWEYDKETYKNTLPILFNDKSPHEWYVHASVASKIGFEFMRHKINLQNNPRFVSYANDMLKRQLLIDTDGDQKEMIQIINKIFENKIFSNKIFEKINTTGPKNEYDKTNKAEFWNFMSRDEQQNNQAPDLKADLGLAKNKDNKNDDRISLIHAILRHVYSVKLKINNKFLDVKEIFSPNPLEKEVSTNKSDLVKPEVQQPTEVQTNGNRQNIDELHGIEEPKKMSGKSGKRQKIPTEV